MSLRAPWSPMKGACKNAATPGSRRRIRTSWIVVGVAVAFLPLAWFCGLPAYRHYKEKRSVHRARAFLVRGDYGNASLCARQALALNPADLGACRVMAQLAEELQAPQMLDWLRRIAELEPTETNKLALARAALALQPAPCPLAAQTLEDLAPSASNSAPYHVTAAQFSLRLGLVSQAAFHFDQAARLEPGNPLHRLNLAVLGLLSTNQALQAEGRTSLLVFLTNGNLAPLALRSLVADALKRNDVAAAERFSRRLLTDARAGIPDHLQLLTCLDRVGSAELEPSLAAAQSRAATNAVSVSAVCAWMTAHGRGRGTLDWVSRLAENVRHAPPVRLAVADSYSSLGDWRGLGSFLQEHSWEELEFLRLALLAHADAELKEPSAAEAHWRLALHQAGERLGALCTLLDLASRWRSEAVRQELLLRIVEKFPRQRWAYRELSGLYMRSGDTRALRRVSAAVLAANPGDTEARNNFAASSMLLRLELPKAHEMALQNMVGHPQDPIIASTYALSLHLQGRTREGLACLERLAPEAVTSPGVALYYALLLAADNQPVKAEEYRRRVEPARLLPEERGLFDSAFQPRAASAR